MPEGDNAISWDFLTVVDWWNLFGLPVLLAVVAVAILIRSRSRLVATAWSAGSRTVLLVGFIHCALAIQALIFLAQEFLAMRVMGIPQSFVSPFGAVFSSLANPILAIGLLRSWRWARRFAIGWYTILALLAILIVNWLYRYHVAVSGADWPELLVSKVMPFFLFAIMFVPRIKRVFTTDPREEHLNDESGSHEGAPVLAGAPAGWPVLSLLTLLFLIVVCSNLVVNAADWAYRLAVESESLP